MAAAFRAGEDMTQTRQVQDMLQAQTEKVHREFAKLPVRVEFVDYDPYKTYQQMRDRVQSERVLRIWTGASDVPMWDARTNWMARAVHDWDHITQQFDFTMGGEYEGYRVAAAKAPQLAPIAFSEIALQAAVANTEGDFVSQQKIVLDPKLQKRLRSEFMGLGDAPAGDPAPIDEDTVNWLAVMLSAVGPKETARALGAIGISEGQAQLLLRAALVNQALIEGAVKA